MLMHKIIEEILLYEGLEMTHAIDTSLVNLERMWSFDGRVTYDEYSGTIRMTICDKIDKKDFDAVLRHIENFLGYFPAHMVTKNQNCKFDYNKSVNFLDGSIVFGIYFDAKYDQEISEKKLPPFMYHISPSVHENKILKVGLVPKRRDKLSKHPDRIYLTFGENAAEGLLSNKPFVKDVNEFILLEIDVSSLKKVRTVRFFRDPIYAGRGCYTYENIPPQYLTVIKRIKL
jgi:hypothetical protein